MSQTDLPFSQRHFSKFMLGGLGCLAVVTAFGEHDRRGLLAFDMPEAFAAAEESGQDFVGMFPMTFPVSFVAGAEPRGGASRTIPSRGALAAPADDGTGSPVGALPSVAAEVPSEPAASQFAATPAALGNPTGRDGGFGDIPGGSFGSTPVSAIVIDDPDPVDPGDGGDPVVPAVPEPASWLLMLLGIGALGTALRRYPVRRPRLA